jgi:hypothetical protein
MVNQDLLPDDMVDMYSKKGRNRHTSHLESYKNPSSLSSVPPLNSLSTTPTCDIDYINKGKVVGYKVPGGGDESGGQGGVCDPCTDIANGLLTQIAQLLINVGTQLSNIENELSTKSPTGTWFEFNGLTTVSTPPNVVNPSQDQNQIAQGPGTVGYDVAEVYNNNQGRNAEDLWIVNDGPDNLFIISSSDGKTFSPEFQVGNGERRLIHDVYEFRYRSITLVPTSLPVAGPGNALRASEREIVAPYVSIVNNTVSPYGYVNRPNFTAQSIAVGLIDAILPNIAIPDGFALSIIANVTNAGQIYISRTDATVAASRTTMAAGDVRSLFITNTNLVHVAGSVGGQFVDIIVEQP